MYTFKPIGTSASFRRAFGILVCPRKLLKKNSVQTYLSRRQKLNIGLVSWHQSCLLEIALLSPIKPTSHHGEA